MFGPHIHMFIVENFMNWNIWWVFIYEIKIMLLKKSKEEYKKLFLQKISLVSE